MQTDTDGRFLNCPHMNKSGTLSAAFVSGRCGHRPLQWIKTSGREGFSPACALSLCKGDGGGVAEGYNGESITQCVAAVIVGGGEGVAHIEDVIPI